MHGQRGRMDGQRQHQGDAQVIVAWRRQAQGDGKRRHVHGLWRAWLIRLRPLRSEEHTSELQSLMRISYAVFCLEKKKENSMRTLTIHQGNNVNTHIETTRTTDEKRIEKDTY